ncbi:hypothetical protein CE11_01037 [Megavirus courdo11]|uniref:Uncharacterized protein n=1 Tax=Megavirus courdo11 TaxID=1128140 RepID=K7YXA4_9VIRU|nr:hypothetical protein CE11_01037 [Megavirus courdo11]
MSSQYNLNFITNELQNKKYKKHRRNRYHDGMYMIVNEPPSWEKRWRKIQRKIQEDYEILSTRQVSCVIL